MLDKQINLANLGLVINLSNQGGCMLKKSLFIFLAAMFVVAVALPGCCKKAAESIAEGMMEAMEEAADSLETAIEETTDTLQTEIEKVEEEITPPSGGTGGKVKPPTSK